MYNKKIIIFAIIGIISILALSACSLKKSIDKDSDKTGIAANQPDTEEEKIKRDNADTVKNARNGAVKKVRAVDDADHVRGDKNAPVQIIIYSDFECPYCAKFTRTIEQAAEEFKEKVAVVYRHFPLTFHKRATLAAIASECASGQGKFWEMHDKIFADNVVGRLSADQLKKDAADLGLDATEFNQCLATEKYKEKVEAQTVEGKSAGIIGTPTSFVNGEIVIGAYPMDDFTDSAGVERKGLRSIIQRYLK
ncbi:thioredoxin domain-containing protein [Candidatus Falkowbacteria bacterium]|nr:thioredoxin domain-containing protein [Candidatus Falkowbacteria bacterium]